MDHSHLEAEVEGKGGKCELEKITQYTCELKTDHILCRPIVRVFKKCKNIRIEQVVAK